MTQEIAKETAPKAAMDLSAPCPKCRGEMAYVTALPHHHAPQMRRTVFVCYACNQTRNYMLSAAMAEAYAALNPPPEPTGAAANPTA